MTEERHARSDTGFLVSDWEPPVDDNGWEQWKRLVLEKLDRHEAWLVSIDKRIGKLREDIVILKVKCGLWGAAGGLIPALIVALMVYLKGQP